MALNEKRGSLIFSASQIYLRSRIGRSKLRMSSTFGVSCGMPLICRDRSGIYLFCCGFISLPAAAALREVVVPRDQPSA